MESGERTHYDDIILPLLSSNGRYPPYDLRDFDMRHIMRRTTLFIGRHTKIERGHGFAFPDRRHSSFSEVYPGVEIYPA